MASKYYDSRTEDEQDFCILLREGNDPFVGNAVKCYAETVGKREGISEDDPFIGHYVRELLSRDNINGYIKDLNTSVDNEAETEIMRAYLKAKLKKIIDECTVASYTDRRGNPLSPAPLRSVANHSIQTMISLTPGLKKGADGNSDDDDDKDKGVTFNVIVPDKPVKTKEQIALEESLVKKQ